MLQRKHQLLDTQVYASQVPVHSERYQLLLSLPQIARIGVQDITTWSLQTFGVDGILVELFRNEMGDGPVFWRHGQIDAASLMGPTLPERCLYSDVCDHSDFQVTVGPTLKKRGWRDQLNLESRPEVKAEWDKLRAVYEWLQVDVREPSATNLVNSIKLLISIW